MEKQCSKCKQNKPYRATGRVNYANKEIFEDNDGKAWEYNRCPECCKHIEVRDETWKDIKRACVRCNVSKTYFYVTMHWKTGKPQYQDDKRRTWDGYKCPDCKPKYRDKKKTKEPLLLGPKLIEIFTSRKCRMCSKSLLASRYFHCTGCVKDLESDFDLAEAYGTINVGV